MRKTPPAHSEHAVPIPNQTITGRKPHVVTRRDPAPGEDIQIDTTSTKQPPARAMPRDQRCVRCGYPLQGLQCHGNCPECGVPLFVSLMASPNTLAACDLRALNLVTRGVCLVLYGQVLGAMFIYGTTLVWQLLRASSLAQWHTLLKQLIESGLAVSSAVLMLIGGWLATLPLQPWANTQNEKAAHRWALRCASSLFGAAMSIWGLLPLVAPGTSFYILAFGIAITDTTMFYALTLTGLVVFNIALRTRLISILKLIPREDLVDELQSRRWINVIMVTSLLILLSYLIHSTVAAAFVSVWISLIVGFVFLVIVLAVLPARHIASLALILSALRHACRRHPGRVEGSSVRLFAPKHLRTLMQRKPSV